MRRSIVLLAVLAAAPASAAQFTAAEMMKLCKQVRDEFSNVVFFTSKLVFDKEPWYIRLLHNHVAYEMQRRLQLEGMQMVILPMKV